MIFEIEDIPEGGLNLDLLAAKEQFEINQPDCSLSEDIKLRGRLAKIEQDINFSGELQAIPGKQPQEGAEKLQEGAKKPQEVAKALH